MSGQVIDDPNGLMAFQDGDIIALKNVARQKLAHGVPGGWSGTDPNRVSYFLHMDPSALSTYDAMNAIFKVHRRGSYIVLESMHIYRRGMALTYCYCIPGKSGDAGYNASSHVRVSTGGATVEILPEQIPGTNKFRLRSRGLGTYLSACNCGNKSSLPWAVSWHVRDPNSSWITWEVIKINKTLCCAGIDSDRSNKTICSELWENPTICDPHMIQWCGEEENEDNPLCTCINSPVPKYNPLCVDSKCLNTGYSTANMSRLPCPDIIDCSAQLELGEVGGGVDIGAFNVEQNCGKVEDETNNTNNANNANNANNTNDANDTNIAVVLLFILFVFIIIAAGGLYYIKQQYKQSYPQQYLQLQPQSPPQSQP